MLSVRMYSVEERVISLVYPARAVQRSALCERDQHSTAVSVKLLMFHFKSLKNKSGRVQI